MIRSLFDVENMPEDEGKKSDENVKADSESAETKTVAEQSSNQTVAEKSANENVAEEIRFEPTSEEQSVETEPIPQEIKSIKHLPTDEIISHLNKKEDFPQEIKSIKQEEVIQNLPPEEEEFKLLSIPPIESTDFVEEPQEEDSFAELEEAARQIESEIQEETARKTESEVRLESENETKFEISSPANEEAEFEDPKIARLESGLAQIENELLAEKEAEENLKTENNLGKKRKSSVVSSIFDDAEDVLVSEPKNAETFSLSEETVTTSYAKSEESPFQTDTKPESKLETFRRSGMAYSAAIILLAAVVFMMLIGWGADLLFGSSPWGVVVGIVLGSVIGFVQFFRTTSQIFKN